MIKETVGSQGWLGHAPTEGWASYDGTGSNKGFGLITDSNTLTLSNNFWRNSVGQLMLPGFNPNKPFPIYPMSWIMFPDTNQDARDFWFKLSALVGITQKTPEPYDYTITASADSNGTITPSGSITKGYGSSQLFTAAPDNGYQIDTWFLDGNSVQTGGGTYNLTQICASHTVHVTFKLLTLITISGSTGLDSVTMNGLPGNPVTSGGGLYSVQVPYGWSGIVTPVKNERIFEPNHRNYTNVTGNQSNQDYISYSIYDLDRNGSIDLGDIAVLSSYWLETATGRSGDFNNAEIVNLFDLAGFGAVWRKK